MACVSSAAHPEFLNKSLRSPQINTINFSNGLNAIDDVDTLRLKDVECILPVCARSPQCAISSGEVAIHSYLPLTDFVSDRRIASNCTSTLASTTPISVSRMHPPRVSRESASTCTNEIPG